MSVLCSFPRRAGVLAGGRGHGADGGPAVGLVRLRDAPDPRLELPLMGWRFSRCGSCPPSSSLPRRRARGRGRGDPRPLTHPLTTRKNEPWPRSTPLHEVPLLGPTSSTTDNRELADLFLGYARPRRTRSADAWRCSPIDLYKHRPNRGRRPAPGHRDQRRPPQHLRGVRPRRHRADEAGLLAAARRRGHPDLLLHAGDAPAETPHRDVGSTRRQRMTTTAGTYGDLPGVTRCAPRNVIITKQRACNLPRARPNSVPTIN